MTQPYATKTKIAAALVAGSALMYALPGCGQYMATKTMGAGRSLVQELGESVDPSPYRRSDVQMEGLDLGGSNQPRYIVSQNAVKGLAWLVGIGGLAALVSRLSAGQLREPEDE